MITGMFDQIVTWFVKGLSLFLRMLPFEFALGLGRLIGHCLSKLINRKRVAYANLKAAFGSRFTARERKQVVRNHFVHLAQNIVEILCFPKLDKHYLERHITVDHRERYEKHVQGASGTVLITPHFGNWELTQILSGIVGKPMYVLAREQKHSRLNDFLNELRSSHGSMSIHKGGGVRDLIRELRNRGVVGVLGDLSGGRGGAIVEFFGRKTTAPSGIFEIAHKNNATILPCFMVRLGGSKHHVFIEGPFSQVKTADGQLDAEATVQKYYRLLEHWISNYPDQWLWIYKRWKYCFTKKILILKDERTGHTSQSEAIAKEFERVRETLPGEYSLEIQSVDVRFKSNWHRKLLYVLAFFVQPFIQGRLTFLDFFLEKECAKTLQEVYADVIVSAGSGLVPLNLLLKCENTAKSVVVMKPSFPYLPNAFDLLIVPFHDAFPKREQGVVKTLVTPSRVDKSLLETSAIHLKAAASLRTNGKQRISVFIGGTSKSYQLDQDAVRAWLSELKAAAQEFNFELLVTTSRRTNVQVSALVKEALGQSPATKLLVIANEANIPNAVYGMLALSEVAVITEDSVSMISDAVSAGKKVLVLKLGNEKLSKKHNRFHQLLEGNALITFADERDFKAKLSSLNGTKPNDLIQHQSKTIQEALRKLI